MYNYFVIILALPSHVPANASLSAILIADSASNIPVIDFIICKINFDMFIYISICILLLALFIYTCSGKSTDGYFILVKFGNIIIS